MIYRIYVLRFVFGSVRLSTSFWRVSIGLSDVMKLAPGTVGFQTFRALCKIVLLDVFFKFKYASWSSDK